ncbi:MAG: hypothetical protein JSV09_11855 [Thermoplasmata archaeon]|nr:MAG: hypothetical protein JSV09_11855 [Thermoplasmata archaeon]
MILESLVEGKKMDLYTERRTSEMHFCIFCEKISYKKKPVKALGKKWICIDCLRQLKELLDSLKQWEEELTLEDEMKKQLGEGLGLQEL